jgi:hypothetical protein
MSQADAAARRFDAKRDLDGVEEPVRRYFLHALEDGAPLARGVELAMEGRIDPGVPLAFSATQRFVGHAFEWSARAGVGPLRPLRIVDAYDGRGGGSTSGWLLGRRRFMHAEGPDTGRSGAGRAAAEAVWRPWMLLPSSGVDWRVEREDLIVAAFDVPPERARAADRRERRAAEPEPAALG